MKRVLFFLYGVVSYLAFFGTYLYAVGFVGNILVPKAIDSPAEGSTFEGILINMGLLGIFAIQHSVMARKGFKQWWTKFIPKPIERSTYTLLSSLALMLLFWQWRPLGGVIWEVQDPTLSFILYAIFAFGWTLVLITTFLINHFDLFGLRQVWLYLRKKEYTPLSFVTPGPYKLIRHPLYLGWLCAFWAIPVMTAAHLLFAVVTTLYILFAIQLEERDLIREHGKKYVNYRSNVPMIIPFVGKKNKVGGAVPQPE